MKRQLRIIARSSIGRSIGKVASRINNYISRENYSNFRIEMQKSLSPINWFEDGENESLMPNKVTENKTNRIKIRFFHQQSNMWNSVEQLFFEFKKLENVDLLVVLTGASYDMCSLKKQMNLLDYHYIEASDYDPYEDKPDIVIIYHPGALPSLPDRLKLTSSYSKMVVEVPIMVINPWKSPEEMIWNLHQDVYKPDYVILDKYVYDICTKYDSDKNNYVQYGNPKFDSIYHIFNKTSKYPKGWEKLAGKKVFLLATDHGLSLDKVYDDVAFDIYAKYIFSYFYKHKDVGLIFRPHDTYINDLLRTYWSVSDYNILRETIDNSPNIVWDTTDNFAYAYRIADGIISDINCDVTGSSLVAQKPIAVLVRNDMDVHANNAQLTDQFVNIKSATDFYNFVDGVNKDMLIDPKKSQLLMEIVTDSFNGENSGKICSFIMDAFSKKISLFKSELL